MKTLNITLISFIICLGPYAYSQDQIESRQSNVISIKLRSGELINVQNEVKEIKFAQDRENKIDYVELLEGSIIDTTDIREIKLSDTIDTSRLEQNGVNPNLSKLPLLGDGSGG